MPDQEALDSMRAMAEKEFPDRNLDVLRARVASGMPCKEPAREDLLDLIERNLVGDGDGSVTIVLDAAGDWSVVVMPNEHDRFVNYGSTLRTTLQGAVEMAGWVPRGRPHVAAQEDDGETD